MLSERTTPLPPRSRPNLRDNLDLFGKIFLYLSKNRTCSSFKAGHANILASFRYR